VIGESQQVSNEKLVVGRRRDPSPHWRCCLSGVQRLDSGSVQSDVVKCAAKMVPHMFC
jgi:hypothetical protein